MNQLWSLRVAVVILALCMAIPTATYKSYLQRREVEPSTTFARLRQWSALVIALLAISISFCLFVLAIERSDYLDYGDEGYAGRCALNAFTCFIFGCFFLAWSFGPSTGSPPDA